MIYAFSSQVDRIVVLQSDPAFGSAVVTLLLGAIFLFRAGTRRRRRAAGAPDLRTVTAITVLGAVLAVTVVSINAAFLFVAVPYAIALKRTSALVSVVLGGTVGGEEGLRQRGAGAALMVLGATVVVLSSA